MGAKHWRSSKPGCANSFWLVVRLANWWRLAPCSSMAVNSRLGTVSPRRPRLSLVAVGGYGRGELHPNSDIDILILSPEPLSKPLGETIGAFLALLWDLKLEVGHAVCRSVQECVEQGKQDITIATNLLEARLITGSLDTFAALNQAIQPERFWPSAAFFRAKRDERMARHQQYQDTVYTLEPDLKSNPGGLRDIQTLAWVARRQFGATSLYEMTSYGFLSRSEYLELLDCQNFLWRLRFALHVVIDKNDNRMLFDRQRAVARTCWLSRSGQPPHRTDDEALLPDGAPGGRAPTRCCYNCLTRPFSAMGRVRFAH